MFPFVTLLYYAAVAAIIFTGGVRASKGSCNPEFLSLRATKSLQGLAAIGVISHHIAQTPPFMKAHEIQAFTYIGFLFVGLFFFVSGYGLLKSLDTKPDYLNGFLKKRCVPIIVTYYVMNVLFVIWHLLLKTNMEVSEWVCKITGIALLNDNAWFVPVILLMYLSFYLIFKNVKDRRKAFALVFAVTAVQIGWFLFNKHFPWWLGRKDWWKAPGALWMAPWWKRPVALWYEGEWWINSTICFLFGMIVAQNEKKFFDFFSKKYRLKSATAFLIAAVFMTAGYFANMYISYWGEFGPNHDNSTLPRFIMVIVQTFQVLSFVTFVIVFMMKFFAENKVTRFFGKYSLEIYLMQVIPLRTLPKFALFNFEKMDLSLFSSRMLMLLYIVLVIALAVLFALLLNRISAFVLKFAGFGKNNSSAK